MSFSGSVLMSRVPNRRIYPIRLNPLKFNAYRCSACPTVITTVDIHPGITPYMLRCSVCREWAYSVSYFGGVIPESVPEPTLEWYMPEGRDLAELDETFRKHVKKGGLLHRPIPKEHRSYIMLKFKERQQK